MSGARLRVLQKSQNPWRRFEYEVRNQLLMALFRVWDALGIKAERKLRWARWILGPDLTAGYQELAKAKTGIDPWETP